MALAKVDLVSLPSGDASGASAGLVIRVPFTAGGGGSPDDVLIYSANLPYGIRILNVNFLVSTLVALSTIQLRSASGGGGSALSDLFPATALGRLLDTGVGISNATPTLATNGTLAIRRSDNGIAGECLIWYMKT